jgi:hypothetical protein
VGFSTNRCLLVAAVSSASLFLPRLLPAKIAAVALSAVAMRADAEDGFARVAASWTKQDLRHVLDDKPPLRFGDDAEDSLSNRRVIKKPRFLMRGDTLIQALHSLHHVVQSYTIILLSNYRGGNNGKSNQRASAASC